MRPKECAEAKMNYARPETPPIVGKLGSPYSGRTKRGNRQSRDAQQSPLPFRLDEDQASYCSLDQRNPCWAAAGTTGADLDRGRKDSRLANDRPRRNFVVFHDPA